MSKWECYPRYCATANATPDNKSTAVTAEPPTTPQPPASALLILGDSIVKSLGTNGMEKLTKKSTIIITTGGATPTTLPLHESTATATDIVLHVGTNSVNSSTEQPDAIADIIMERADCIRTTNAGADIHISSIIQRSDLVDENESTTTANEKILSTNELLKEKCTKANMKFIDNSNIEHNDLYDGLHMNTGLNRHNKPWFTKGLRKSCKKKTRLYKIFLSCRTITAEARYKSYKNRLTSILRASKKAYYCKLLSEQRYNTTETWKILRTVIGNNVHKSSYPSHFVFENNQVGDKTDIANIFNKFFTNIGPDLADKIIVPNDVSVLDYLTSKNKKTMFLTPTDENEVIIVVNSCNSKTSIDSEGLNMKLVKSIICSIVKPVTHICNSSLLSGIFPDRMKIAKIIPLFKSGSKTEINNYRPISLLPQFSKILEKIYNNRLNNFITTSNILNSCQYGFRQGVSTSHALVDLVSEITNSLNKRKHAIGVFIDLRKAFDTVNHQLLCKKLEFYGIRGIAQNWIKSYLSNRTQYVCYEEHTSESLQISCGVPQGSILGPQLFILYVNDMCNVSKLLKYVLFADDTNILYSHDHLPDLVTVLCTELDRMYTWFSVNKLSLNIAKTNYIVFGKHKQEQCVALKINDIVIERVDATKFLGVVIDQSLNWNNHINLVRSKLAKVASVLYKVSHVIDRSSLHTLYCSLFLPYLMYCCEIWGNNYKTKLQCIVSLQKRVMRTVYGVSRLEHTNYLFYDSHSLKFPDIVELKTVLFMFKAYHIKLPNNLQNLFIKRTPLHSTRSTHQFIREDVRINTRAMTLSIYGVKLWNSLPTSITSLTSCHVFKRLYVNKLLMKYAT